MGIGISPGLFVLVFEESMFSSAFRGHFFGIRFELFGDYHTKKCDNYS